MNITVNTIRGIIVDVLNALYQQFWFSVILAILIMFLFMYAREKGWKQVFKAWIENFKVDIVFRKKFLLVFYVAMILLRTLLNRSLWKYPLSNVIGTWGLYYEDGTLATEGILNLALFIPFTYLLLWCTSEKVFGSKIKFWRSIWMVLKSSFLFSAGIEFAQLFLQLGTFQLSDIFYNTLGGLIGGIIYYIAWRIKNRKK